MPATKNKITCPVCDMEVTRNSEFKTEYKGQSYYFCSQSDLKKFQQQPQVYSWKEERAGKTGKAA